MRRGGGEISGKKGGREGYRRRRGGLTNQHGVSGCKRKNEEEWQDAI